jgi:hypothetical protein
MGRVNVSALSTERLGDLHHVEQAATRGATFLPVVVAAEKRRDGPSAAATRDILAAGAEAASSRDMDLAHAAIFALLGDAETFAPRTSSDFAQLRAA